MNKNTVLFVEPRVIENGEVVLNHFVNVLGYENWHYVFYCGKEKKQYWEARNLNKVYEVRELDVDNFPKENLYSDFMKQKWLWESLYGEFVLTAQLDTWIMKDNGYSIYDFIKLNKSYIGGNMCYPWLELSDREKINFEYRNFNGGLSLRKREDMIRVIDNYPPERTNRNEENAISSIYADAEDAYFTLGCYKLGLLIGNDEATSYFAVHTIFKERFFGMHQPCNDIKESINKLFPNLNKENPFLRL